MAYARVTMAEFNSRAEMHGAIEELGKNAKSVFPEILMFAAMETAENSQLTISVSRSFCCALLSSQDVASPVTLDSICPIMRFSLQFEQHRKRLLLKYVS